MGSSFWHSGGCYPPLQSPRYSARSLVKEKKIFHDVLFEDRLKPPVGADIIRPRSRKVKAFIL
jgi:hypothetical protein